MTRTLVIVLVLLAAPLAAPSTTLLARAAARDLTPRVRPMDADTRALLQLGVELSPSLRALVASVERTDVVVYVKAARLPQRMDGQLTFVSAAAGLRYVIVEIAWDRSEVRRLATLGHEMQHVIEVAARPDIIDAATLARAFVEFGIQRERQRAGWRAFDTDAAMDAGQRVWKEVTAAAADD